ncbi:helix-turn-helix transcriptional regulator [Zobellella maritima]|uniref:helix-turn-helix transcriptional regulator n=1 Tax=Zobellella maritima TaxID=2059725 RepID=UPI000E302CA8|nr:helix-turn-helix transcriptional regulator [Zobellella maritima]
MAAVVARARLLLLLSRMYDSGAGREELNLTLGLLCRELALDGMTLALSPKGDSTDPGGWHYFDAGRCYRNQGEFGRLLAEREPLGTEGCYPFGRSIRGFVLPRGQEAGGGVLVVQGGQGLPEWLAMLRQLAEQLALWQLHYWSLHRLREQNRCLRYWINATERPQLLLCGEYCLVEANRAAHRLLDGELGVRLDANGQLQVCLGEPAGLGRWRSLALLAGGLTEDHLRLVLDTGQGALVMHVMPLRNHRQHWLLTLKDPDYQPNVDADSLGCLFELTRTEKELLILLGKGCSSREIASYRCVSRETVRSTLKSIFQKTGCHRQSDLLLLMQAMS